MSRHFTRICERLEVLQHHGWEEIVFPDVLMSFLAKLVPQLSILDEHVCPLGTRFGGDHPDSCVKKGLFEGGRR
jgi:hypothetical protein